MKKGNKKQYLVIGLGRFGSAAAKTLAEGGVDVLGVDCDIAVAEAHRDLLTETVCADGMDRQILEQLGAADFDVVLVTMGADFRTSGVVTMHLKEMGVPYVIVKAHDEFQGRMLSKLGADKVLFPERDMAQRVAHNLLSDKILDFIEVSPEFSMMEMSPRKEWIGKTLSVLNLRKSEKINVIAIKGKNGLNALPDADTTIEAEDRLLVIAKQA